MTLVCPQCGRAFEGAAGVRPVCPGCAHSWDPTSDYAPTLVSQDERKAVPFLVVTYAGGKREELPLISTISVGRSPEANVAINDLRLSRKHFQVEKRGESWYLKDLGSSTGTLVGGKRVAEARLSPLDTITAGETTFQYMVRMVDTTDTSRKVKVSVVEAPAAAPTAPVVPRIALSKDRVVLGRGAECDVVLSSPVVSRAHAAITKEPGGPVVEDLGSANGVFVNGRLVKRHALAKGDRLRIGPYVLSFDGAELAQEDQQGRITLEAVQIGKRVGALDILKDVSVVIRPNEFVGLLGPSGAGKSTFMDTLNGFRPATSGQVLVNGEDLYSIFKSFKTNIGYVPQEDIIHRELTVWDALYYTAKLRLPEDTSEDEVRRIIEEVITILDLGERKDTRIGSLSGGQRKRVSVGVELITKPPLLFLDEPTSGLDPGTEEKIMTLFRNLAKGGRTVVLTTHVMENVELLDLIVVLVKGRLAYYGPPKETLAYFDIPKITKIYEKLESRKPEEWAERYQASKLYKTYVLERQAASRAAGATQPIPPEQRRPMPHAQFYFLLMRYLRTLLGDRKNLLFLILPGPLIGFLMTLPFDAANELQHRNILLFMTVTAVFCGTFNSFREIVKERAIYKRERMVNLQIVPYILSKLVLLSAFFVVEVFLLLCVVEVFEGFDVKGNFLLHYFALLLTAIAAAGLGLIISALVNSQEKAIGLLIIVIIPQIVFSGGLSTEGLTGFSAFLSWFMVGHWGFYAVKEIAGPCDAALLGYLMMNLIYTAVYAGIAAAILKMQDVK
ncbi:MAG: FHA domain-containing protein [Planctomycetes bacterium]|nr:FHA domain-containing protein [Planctomycetota bacterium]